MEYCADADDGYLSMELVESSCLRQLWPWCVGLSIDRINNCQEVRIEYVAVEKGYGECLWSRVEESMSQRPELCSMTDHQGTGSSC